MATLGGILVAIGYLVGGVSGAGIFLVIALVMNFVAYWFSDQIALASAGAKPLSESEAPSLYQMVRELATRADLPMPRLYVIPSEQPNAFATGRNPSHSAVAVTSGITKLLSEDELRGVPVDRVTDGRAVRARREATVDRGLDLVEGGTLLGRQEPPDRRPEGDRGRLGEGQAVDLGRGRRHRAHATCGARRRVARLHGGGRARGRSAPGGPDRSASHGRR